MKIDVILELANDYSINANFYHDNGKIIKEYANLCSATAIILLALQSEEINEKTRKILISQCEINIKKQEEIENYLIQNEPEKKSRVSEKNTNLLR